MATLNIHAHFAMVGMWNHGDIKLLTRPTVSVEFITTTVGYLAASAPGV